MLSVVDGAGGAGGDDANPEGAVVALADGAVVVLADGACTVGEEAGTPAAGTSEGADAGATGAVEGAIIGATEGTTEGAREGVGDVAGAGADTGGFFFAVGGVTGTAGDNTGAEEAGGNATGGRTGATATGGDATGDFAGATVTPQTDGSGVATLHRAGRSRARVVLTSIGKAEELKRAHKQMGLPVTTLSRPTQQFFGGVDTLPCTKSRHGSNNTSSVLQSGRGAGACAPPEYAYSPTMRHRASQKQLKGLIF